MSHIIALAVMGCTAWLLVGYVCSCEWAHAGDDMSFCHSDNYASHLLMAMPSLLWTMLHCIATNGH